MENYVWLIPFLPLVGLPLNGILGRKMPRWIISIVACLLIGISFAFSLILFLRTGGISQEIILYKWIVAGKFSIDIGFRLDALSFVMLLVVTGVSFLIHIYSIGYMHHDSSYSRFFAYLNLFTFSMLILILANNFLMLFVGWEGVGLCSYLLIGFWYEDNANSDAGKKAFIVNKVGDFGFTLAIILIFWTFGTININQVIHLAPEHFAVGSGVITAITLLLFMGAAGKSAQIPLYVWLPDAMAGPTPVSALIHAATMVTAGIYMVARCSPMFMLAPFTMGLIAVIGALTAFFAASIGLVQNDIKKVLAYSTISQLGYMFLALGVGAFATGIFHLMTHAFFKALLFMAAGSVMHSMAGELDMQKMGGLKRYMPITYITAFTASLAISGIFPFAGFFSKDEILLSAFNYSKPLWLLGLITAGMTAFYIFRFIFNTFFGSYRSKKPSEDHLHESPSSMTIPLIILAILSIIGGLPGVSSHLPILGRSKLLTEKINILKYLESVVYHAPESGGHNPHFVGNWLALISLIVAAAGISIAYIFYLKKPGLPKQLAVRFEKIYRMLVNKYWVDEIYQFLFVDSSKKFAHFLWKSVDDKVIDRIVNGVAKITVITSGISRVFDEVVVDGLVNETAKVTVLTCRISQIFDEGAIDWLVNAIGRIFRKGSGIFRLLQTGYVQSYILLIIIGIIVLIWYLL